MTFKQAGFTFEKVVIDNEMYYKLVGMDGIARMAQLPGEYFAYYPHFYLTEYLACSIADGEMDGDIFRIYKGDIFTPTEYDRVVRILKEAGKRLYGIMLKERWTGVEVVKI